MERITHSGSGFVASETPDGQSVLYKAKDEDGPLLAFSLMGSGSHEISKCVSKNAFAVAAPGVYYLECGDGSDRVVHVIDQATGKDRRLGKLTAYDPQSHPGLAVSADGATILYSRIVSRGSDLVLIENFR